MSMKNAVFYIWKFTKYFVYLRGEMQVYVFVW